MILLTARSELDERLEGLNLGADDYLTKPFYIEELIARLHTIMRRSQGEPTHILKAGDLAMDMVAHTVKRAGQEIHLSMREFSLLEYLMRSPVESSAECRFASMSGTTLLIPTPIWSMCTFSVFAKK